MTEAFATQPRDERRLAALCFAVVLLFALYVLADDKVSLGSFLGLAAKYVSISLMILGTAMVAYAGLVFIRTGVTSKWREPPARAIAAAFVERWREDRMFTLAWPLALFMLLLPAFNAFKQRILPNAGFAYDPELAAIDRWLFGADPGIWLHQLIGSNGTTAFFDAMYHSWFVPTTLGLCVVGLCAGTRTRAQYMLSYIGTWIMLGAVAAYWLPAAGPAFFSALVDGAGAGPFTAVHDRLLATSQAGSFLTSLHNQQYLLANLDHSELVVGGGISAIPSVHNAMAVLFAVASFRAHWLLGVLMSGFAMLIWIASVYLNWHYAIDGIVGGAGAILLWFGSGYLVDLVISASRSAESFPAAPAASRA